MGVAMSPVCDEAASGDGTLAALTRQTKVAFNQALYVALSSTCSRHLDMRDNQIVVEPGVDGEGWSPGKLTTKRFFTDGPSTI